MSCYNFFFFKGTKLKQQMILQYWFTMQFMKERQNLKSDLQSPPKVSIIKAQIIFTSQQHLSKFPSRWGTCKTISSNWKSCRKFKQNHKIQSESQNITSLSVHSTCPHTYSSILFTICTHACKLTHSVECEHINSP